MKISKEHSIALKISLSLFIIAFIITYFIWYYNHNFSVQSYWQNWKFFAFNNIKYYIFIVLSIFIYFVSYVLAKITIKPIEDANKLLKEFNHNLAHEIKTPISIIKSNMELLNLSYEKKLVDSSIEELNTITEITDWLLFLSEKSTNISKEKLLLNDIIKKYNSDFIIINEEGEFYVNANSVLINRMIDNILSNAQKYSIDWTKIIINITSNKISIINDIEKTIIEENLLKLFNTFFQLDNSRNKKGYWLWLSIAMKISNIHNIKLDLKSYDNKFEVIIKK